MSGDHSRIAFDPWLDDASVLLEQGRPLTDRDWNDQALQLNRRTRAGTLDTIGTAAVPIETPEGFEILLNGGSVTIGRGRIYVHGLLAENHGTAPDGGSLEWDPKLEELFGSAPLNYTDQPYYPNPAALPTGGRHVAYLDVWQREVTRFIRPGLVEQALGVDTTTRLQTVWQVKLHPANTDTTCTTPLEQLNGWLPEHAPSAGRLSVTTTPVPGQPDPCQIPPTSGYKGLENQLYRVEIHESGEPGTATFKWSRDNASVEASVLEIPSLTQLVVDSIGKDDVLRFSDGDWIEITDNWLELHGEPGLIRRIASGNGVDSATRTITLESPLPAGQFPTDLQDVPEADRRTRIRRWDQRNAIVDAAGAEVQNLNDPASDGTITVPADSTQILLEHNIVVSFSVQPGTGRFRSGDYWVFAARAVDASVEELTDAPPRGIHHHYAKLAVLTFPNTETDCRVFWPPTMSAPPAETPAEECGCTVCVTPESHANGSLTIQEAIDEVQERGGGTVCLEVGAYELRQPLQIVQAGSLRMVGKGLKTEVRGDGRLVQIAKSGDISLESMSLLSRPKASTADGAVVVDSSSDVRLERLAITIRETESDWSAVTLTGEIARLTLRENAVTAPIGVSTTDSTDQETGLTDLRIEDNTFECESIAVRLSDVAVHEFVSHIRANRVGGCKKAGVWLEGRAEPGHGIDIAGNTFAVQSDGIVAALDGIRVIDNQILQAAEASAKDQAGIRLLSNAAKGEPLNNVRIIGNRIAGFGHAAIEADVRHARLWTVAGNHVDGGHHGVVFDEMESGEQIVIENNHFADLSGFGLRAEGRLATMTITGNQIQTRHREPAVLVVFESGDTTFSHNQVSRKAPPNEIADVVLTSTTLIVGGNRVRDSRRSMELKTNKDHYTVLGNICNGSIGVNGPNLTGPWPPLNVQNV